MDFHFEWHSSYADVTQQAIIQDQIKKEIIIENLKKKSEELFITLFDKPHSRILTGSALNERDEEVIKINIRLQGNTLKIKEPDYEYC